MNDSLLSCVAFSLAEGAGPVAFSRLVGRFGTPSAALDAVRGGFTEGLDARAAAALREPGLLDRASREIEGARKAGAAAVTRFDGAYPEALKNIYAPPVVLWVRGSLPAGDSVAIVGSRNATAYGLKTARRFAREIAAAGTAVVSGLARGIDAAAHEGALDAKGATVAVLGGGLGKIYPRENAPLAEKIVNGGGAVVSEYAWDVPAQAGRFPARNRIVAGLSRAVLVVEADAKSGSLITADEAVAEGRDVYAVPGNVDSPRSTGTNRLIRQGARSALDPRDLVEEARVARRAVPADEDERLVAAALADGPASMDDVVEKTGWDAARASRTLSTLALRGVVREYPGKRFVYER